MNITRRVIVDATPTQVWQVLGPNYADAYKWASTLNHSTVTNTGSTLNGAPCTGRTCDTTIGPFKETIVAYDEENGHIAYEATGDKMPGFVRKLTANWHLTQTGNSKTQVDLIMDMDLAAPFNFLMGPMMKLQMGGVMTKTVEEFKHYVETGKPHPRKVKMVEKAKRKAA